MAESVYPTKLGTEISERSTELVLPESTLPESRQLPGEREIAASKSEATYRREIESESTSNPETKESSTKIPVERRGLPLPGDRGRESRKPRNQRPSFWRRIALGRLGAKARDMDASDAAADKQLLAPAQPTTTRKLQPQIDSVERRIVEPLLQALVSVESKLERSHVEIIGRSDQVEQRLTQLWDIEEQLGKLGEVKESLALVSEQQSRLESSLGDQNRMLRWLIGVVVFALAGAVLIVAALLL